MVVAVDLAARRLVRRGLDCFPMMDKAEVQIYDKTFTVYGYEDEGWFKLIKDAGQWNEFNLNHLKHFIDANSICIDAGANLGMMTLAMASLAPKGMVYSFEPDPKTYAALVKTVAASNLGDSINLSNSVLGAENIGGTFVEDPDWRSSSHFLLGSGETRSVSIDSLDLPHVDLIKIDVEGMEIDVLQGANDTIQKCKPLTLIEFNSYALVHYQNVLPRNALKYILEVFPRVFYFADRTGDLIELNDPETFLKNNMLNGFVDDLLCGFPPG